MRHLFKLQGQKIRLRQLNVVIAQLVVLVSSKVAAMIENHVLYLIVDKPELRCLKAEMRR
jgi:hypothetical protein